MAWCRDARYETYDSEVDLDTLKLTPHPGRAAGAENGPWYGESASPRIPPICCSPRHASFASPRLPGDRALAHRRRPFLKKGIRAMRSHMWDEAQGCFLAVGRDGMRKLSWPPSAAWSRFRRASDRGPGRAHGGGAQPALTGARRCRFLQLTASMRNTKATAFGAAMCGHATVYQTVSGLAHYGHRRLAGELAGQLLDNALKAGVSEHYDSQTGAPLGVPNLGMSAVILTMALEGLSPRHAIRVA